MDEKKETQSPQESPKGEEKKETTEESQKPVARTIPESSGKDKPKSAIETAQELAERIDSGNKKQEELLDRQDKMLAEQRLGGRAEAGMLPPEKKKPTDIEYSEMVERGEANPLADDGFI